MGCEVSFDTRGSDAGGAGTGSRLVEIVDDEMRRVALVGERGTLVVTEPGAYGAILKLDVERTVTKAFEIVEGASRVIVAFPAAMPADPPRTPGLVRTRPAIVALLFVFCLGGVAAWRLSSRGDGMTEMASRSEMPWDRAAPNEGEFAAARHRRMRRTDNSVPCTVELAALSLCGDAGATAHDGPPPARVPDINFERAMRRAEPQGSTNGRPIPSPTDRDRATAGSETRTVEEAAGQSG